MWSATSAMKGEGRFARAWWVVSTITDRRMTPSFAGGVMEDTRGWTGRTKRKDFNPYEAAALVGRSPTGSPEGIAPLGFPQIRTCSH